MTRKFLLWEIRVGIPAGLIAGVAYGLILDFDQSLVVGLLVAGLFLVIPLSDTFIAVSGLKGSEMLVLSEVLPACRSAYPVYYEVAEEVANLAGLPRPELYISAGNISDLTAMNATRRFSTYTMLVVSPALLRMLDREELKGVLAHEMMHLKHKDRLPSTRKEIRADMEAARLLGTGHPLASALEKIAGLCGPDCCHDDNGGRLNRFLYEYHPPAKERAKRLRSGNWRNIEAV